MCFQETNGNMKQNFILPGYKCVARQDRLTRTGGGVAIFVKHIATTSLDLKTEAVQKLWQLQHM